MGLLQGATELFPVSSLGHAVLVPSLLHWSFKQSDSSFVPFLVLLHLGTATALLVLYRSQWVSIIRGFFTAAFRGSITSDSERLAMLLMTGTLPAAVLGVFLESHIKAPASSRCRSCLQEACLWPSTSSQPSCRGLLLTPARASFCATSGQAGSIHTAGTASPPGWSPWLC